jgi:hypothetical protein
VTDANDGHSQADYIAGVGVGLLDDRIGRPGMTSGQSTLHMMKANTLWSRIRERVSQ